MPRTRSIAWAQLKVGLIAFVALGLAAVLIVAVGGQGGFFWQRFPLKARFTSIAGLKSGAVVRLNGKEVGQVTGIDFADAEIEVTMEISKDVRPLITTDSTAAIGSLSLLGEPIVDLTASRKGSPLPDGAFVRVIESGGLFGGLTASAERSLGEAGDLIAGLRAGRGTIGRLVTDDALYREMERLVKSVNQFAAKLAGGRGTLGQLIDDPTAYRALTKSLDNLGAITEQIRAGSGSVGRLISDDAFARSLSATTANLDAITSRLNKGQGTVGKLLSNDELFNRLNELADRTNQLATGLDEGRGTVGKLLHDEELYVNLNNTVLELRSLIADVRKDPKKFLHLTFRLF